MDLPDHYEDENYNAVARFFHWVIAFLIVGMIGLGLTMGSVNYGIPKFEVYDLHKSIGLLILMLAIARIIWRFASIPPEALDTHAHWERALAKAAHFYLYAAMIVMPVSGWLMSSSGGRPPTFFGLPVPRLLEKNEALSHIFKDIHQYVAYGLIAVIALHVAGALKHHLIDKDATLRRMTGQKLQWFKIVFVIMVLDIALSGAAFVFLKETVMENVTNAQGVAMAAPAELPDMSTLADHEWMIDPRSSSLSFETQVMGTPFVGHFNSFSGQIILDPDNMQMARADIGIDLKDVVTGDKSRDDTLRTAAWFSVEQFPKARFVTSRIEKMDDNRYIAVGNLTIRDVTMPLSIPFTLDMVPAGEVNKAHMQAKITLNRLDFGVGQGEWQSTENVPDAVAVTIDVQALQPVR